MIKVIKPAKEDDWWDKIPENIKDEIIKSIKDLDKGKGVPDEEVKKLYPQWFLK